MFPINFTVRLLYFSNFSKSSENVTSVILQLSLIFSNDIDIVDCPNAEIEQSPHAITRSILGLSRIGLRTPSRACSRWGNRIPSAQPLLLVY